MRVINLLDDCSRVNVDSLAAVTCRSERVWEAFCRGAERYGLPAEFLNDNGRAYISPADETPVLFQARLMSLGVAHLHSSPRHPQTCGKVERFHQTQRRWLEAQPQARTIAELQALLDRFRHIYNHERTHRAIGRRTPAEVWAAQPPAGPCRDASEPEPLVSLHRTDASGTVTVSGRLRIALGVRWAGVPVTVIRRGEVATVIDGASGEIARELTVDPNRRYQPTGRQRGGRVQPRRRREV